MFLTDVSITDIKSELSELIIKAMLSYTDIVEHGTLIGQKYNVLWLVKGQAK